MNDIREIKALLEKYYEGESTNADECRLREYFASDAVAEELRAYRSLFAYPEYAKERLAGAPECPIVPMNRDHRIKKLRYVAAGAAACLLATVFITREQHPVSEASCTGTYVMVNGVCYDDLSLVKYYAAEAIDQVTKPVGNGAATDALDFLDEKEMKNEK